MTEEFIKWVDNIKIFIEKRVGKYATVRTHAGGDSIDICVDCVSGMRFWSTFDQREFIVNNYHQRRSLAKVRREDMIWTMRDHCKDIMQMANKLN